MFLRYWKNDAATAGKFVGDWMLTGDLGEMDAAGSIRFISRDDDIITSCSYRIGPGEVEDCLLGHSAVRLVAVIGVPDELRTEVEILTGRGSMPRTAPPFPNRKRCCRPG